MLVVGVTDIPLDMPDWPDECVPRGLNPEKFPALARLALFCSDLGAARQYLELVGEKDRSDAEREAFFSCALLKFLGCFESTAGHRRQPLSPKKVFGSGGRQRVEEYRQIRNCMIAHDEQLYPGSFLIAAVADNATVRRVYAVKLGFYLHSIQATFDDLGVLVNAAFEWGEAEIYKELNRVADELNTLDDSVRQKILRLEDFRIELGIDEGRWRQARR